MKQIRKNRWINLLKRKTIQPPKTEAKSVAEMSLDRLRKQRQQDIS